MRLARTTRKWVVSRDWVPAGGLAKRQDRSWREMSEPSQYQQEEGAKPSPETFLPEPGGHIKVTSGIK